MYELTIHSNFLATHAVTIQGIDEGRLLRELYAVNARDLVTQRKRAILRGRARGIHLHQDVLFVEADS